MKMLRTLMLVGLMAVVPVAVVSAQVVLPTSQLASGATVDPALEKAGQAAIRGVAVDANTKPVASAKVQLRNLGTRQIEQLGTANPFGEFSFVVRPETPYIVEVADVAGRIIAVGNVIIARAGDVAAATVALPTRVAAVTGLFTETATSVSSAASNLGISTVSTVLPLVSPEK
jgi:hypothetical protein